MNVTATCCAYITLKCLLRAFLFFNMDFARHIGYSRNQKRDEQACCQIQPFKAFNPIGDICIIEIRLKQIDIKIRAQTRICKNQIKDRFDKHKSRQMWKKGCGIKKKSLRRCESQKNEDF